MEQRGGSCRSLTVRSSQSLAASSTQAGAGRRSCTLRRTRPIIGASSEPLPDATI